MQEMMGRLDAMQQQAAKTASSASVTERDSALCTRQRLSKVHAYPLGIILSVSQPNAVYALLNFLTAAQVP